MKFFLKKFIFYIMFLEFSFFKYENRNSKNNYKKETKKKLKEKLRKKKK